MAVCRVTKNKGLAWICRSSAFFSVLFIFQVKHHHSICARLFLIPPSTSSKSKEWWVFYAMFEPRVDVWVYTCGSSNKKVRWWILRQVVFICFLWSSSLCEGFPSPWTWIFQSGLNFFPPQNDTETEDSAIQLFFTISTFDSGLPSLTPGSQEFDCDAFFPAITDQFQPLGNSKMRGGTAAMKIQSGEGWRWTVD